MPHVECLSMQIVPNNTDSTQPSASALGTTSVLVHHVEHTNSFFSSIVQTRIQLSICRPHRLVQKTYRSDILFVPRGPQLTWRPCWNRCHTKVPPGLSTGFITLSYSSYILLQLSDAKSWACGSIGSYFEQFKSLTNLQADVGKWTNCDQEKTFKDAKIQNLVDEDVGDKLMARLIVIGAHLLLSSRLFLTNVGITSHTCIQAYAATIMSLPTITEDVVKG